MLIATYGTLKRGYGNWNRLLNGRSTFIAEGILRNHKLYHSGFPVAAPSIGEHARVEVFSLGGDIDHCREVVQSLDYLEGYSAGFPEGSMYHRQEHTIYGDDGNEYLCSLYVGNPTFWRGFQGMRVCEKDDNTNTYKWS